MWRVLAAGVMLVATFASLPAQAQTDDETELAMRKELVWRYVHTGDYSAEAIVNVAEQRILAEFDESDSDLPSEVKSWMEKTFSASAVVVTQAIIPDVEQMLFDIYFMRFTSEDMEKLQLYHDFRFAPERAAIFAEAESQTTMGALEFLERRLPPADFAYLVEAGSTSPFTNMLMVALAVGRPVSEDYAESFNHEIRTHCGTAPKGVWFCERAYVPIPTFGGN